MQIKFIRRRRTVGLAKERTHGRTGSNNVLRVSNDAPIYEKLTFPQQIRSAWPVFGLEYYANLRPAQKRIKKSKTN